MYLIFVLVIIESALAFNFPTYITPNIGWYLFPYSSMGVGHFTSNITSISTVTLTGCYCPGDVLELLDNGFPIGFEVNCDPVLPLPPVGGTCTAPITDNSICLENEGGFFCNIRGIIPPGQHNFTVIVSKANYNFNQAAIRLDTYCLIDQAECCQYWYGSYKTCVNAVVG